MKKKGYTLTQALDALQTAEKLLEKYDVRGKKDAADDEKDDPWESPERLAEAYLSDARLEIENSITRLARAYGLLTGGTDFRNEANRPLNGIWENDEEPEDGIEEDPDEQDIRRMPFVSAEDLTGEDRSLIHALAKAEKENLELARTMEIHGVEDVLHLDEVTAKKLNKVTKKATELREKLMDSDLANDVLDFEDPVDDMMRMSAVLLYLYAMERTRAYKEKRKPDEDFLHAGSHLYKFGAARRLLEEDDSQEHADDDDDDDD